IRDTRAPAYLNRVAVDNYLDPALFVHTGDYAPRGPHIAIARHRYGTARRGEYSPPNRLDHEPGRGILAPTRGTVPIERRRPRITKGRPNDCNGLVAMPRCLQSCSLFVEVVFNRRQKPV